MRKKIASALFLVVLFDQQGKAKWANEAAKKAIGLPRNELLGLNCKKLWKIENEKTCIDCPVTLSLEKQQREDKTVDCMGSYFISAAPLKNIRGKYVGTIAIRRKMPGKTSG